MSQHGKTTAKRRTKSNAPEKSKKGRILAQLRRKSRASLEGFGGDIWVATPFYSRIFLRDRKEETRYSLMTECGTGFRLVLGETETHPMPNETIAGLFKTAFAWREQWFNEPDTALKDIAKEANTDISDVSKQMRLAFLAPDIVRALLDGTTSDDWTPERLRRLDDLPVTWSEQRLLFGLAQN